MTDIYDGDEEASIVEHYLTVNWDVLIGPIDEIGIEVSIDRDFLNKTTGIKQRESKTDSHKNCCTDVSLSARKTLKVACHVKAREIFG